VSPALFARQLGSLPVLINFPHSGTYVPEEMRESLTSAAQALPDTDWFVPQLYSGVLKQFAVSSLIATHSRYVVDLNRAADGSLLYPGQTESGVCPTETFGGTAIYRSGRELSAAQTRERIERYWRPYHEALASLRDDTIATHGYCVIWDAHSIRSREPRLFEGELPELNLGTWNGRSAGAELISRVAALIAGQPRFSHVVDGRFTGGYITRYYGDPAGQVHAMQLEIAQRAYMLETDPPQFDPQLASPLMSLLEQIIAQLTTLKLKA
jgi:N-formylglutamate deformylase